MNSTFSNFLWRWGRQNGDSPAILGLGGRQPLSWRCLPDTISTLSRAICATGAGEGSRIAIVLPPGPEMVTVFLAVMHSSIAVPLNPELTATELKASLARLRPHLIIFRDGFQKDVALIAASAGCPALRLDWGSNDVAGSPHVVASETSRRTEDRDALSSPPATRLILQTSGTTARPKLVPLTSANLEASAFALIKSLSLTEDDRGLNLLPQYHIGGLWDLVAGPLLSGGSVICGGKFSPSSLEACCRLKPTWVQLAPAMLHAALDRSATPLHELRFIRSVSAALPAALKARAETALRVPVVEIYGMTETAGVITSNPLQPRRQLPGSVGSTAGPEITIRDQSGAEQAAGTEGDVYIRGAQLSPGYIDATPEESKAFDRFGFNTGDIGKLDKDGNLQLLGRSKDLINRGGEMVSPAEVEYAILGLSGVLDAAVFGIPDARLGEDIAAAVIMSESAPLSGDLAAMRARLLPVIGPMRLPSQIFRVDKLPRTAGGKLQRHKLAEQFAFGIANAAPRTTDNSPGAPAWGPADILPQWVADNWASVLELGHMPADQDFFAAGGCSIKAAQAVILIQENFQQEIIYVSSIYEAPTPRLYAAFLEKHYPAVAARVLGDAIKPKSLKIGKVMPAMTREFEALIANPLPSFQAPLRRCGRAIFVLGAPRSGSTLLRAMLAGHPALFAPPELYLLSHGNLAERRAWYGKAFASQLEGLPRAWMAATGCTAPQAIAEVAALEENSRETPEMYRLLQEAIGPRVLVDKTPYYGIHRHVLDTVDALFEDAFFIHLSRHPYGMIRSFVEANLAQLWWPRLVGAHNTPCPFHPQQLAEMIWDRIHSNVSGFLRSRPPVSWVHVQYEQLVGNPEDTCRAIASALNLQFQPNMLDPLADPAARMTDGLLTDSRMIGDPKFHRHNGIDRSSADLWKHHYGTDFLSEATWVTAAALGHGGRLDDENLLEVFNL